MPSVALVFQIQVLDQRNLLQPLGVVDPTTLDQVVAMLHSLVS
jgi:mRNA-degrading endonuclease toxin of MazEF toxin-antitoxin module